MLKYLIGSAEQLVIMMAAIGLLLAYIVNAFSERGRRYMLAGILSGIALSFVILYFRQYTNKFSTGLWNLRIFISSGAVFVAFVIFLLFEKKMGEAGGTSLCVSAAVMTALLMTYYLPPFLMQPHSAFLTDANVLSSSYLLKLVGMALGFLLSLVTGISAYRGACRMGKTGSLKYAILALALNILKYAALSLGILLARRLIKSNHALFVISKNATNHANWFIYSTLFICLVMQGSLFIRSFTHKEPYSNSAERRKIIAKWRKARKWTVATFSCFVLTVLILTAGKAYDSRIVELSPIESAILEDGKIYVSFDQVSDGGLHRFGYTTDRGVTIRFIVIKKPNSSSYGIGLDACEICGQTGYYQRGDKVVCNLCDVVMNINTIGFKGGCNPIVIDYSIENGFIVVPVETLLKHESIFK